MSRISVNCGKISSPRIRYCSLLFFKNKYNYYVIDIANSIADADSKLQHFISLEVRGGQALLELEKGISHRLQLLKMQIDIQKSLIKVEKRKIKRLCKISKKIDEKRGQWRDKYLSILNKEGFKPFLAINLRTHFSEV